MSATRRPLRRGFTLLELMIVVGIISLLSTVALPVYKRATLRTRTAERGSILHALAIGIQDAYVRGKVTVGGPLIGVPDPAGIPSPYKRHFNSGAVGWPEVGVLIEGNCFYTYEFQASESNGLVDAQYWISATGDLDGDTNLSTKLIGATRTGGHWDEWDPWPADGAEDDVTFGTF